jgi:thiol-disulfide isomerase/thioredoxin
MTIATLLLALIATPTGDATGEPLLLDFHASWCGPCKQMRPAIEQLIQKGYQVKSVDVDDSPDLAARYKVQNVPTFIVVDPSGEPLARTMGAQPAGQLARMYLAAKAKLRPIPTANDPPDDERNPVVPTEEIEPADERPANVSPNPNPWETVVRIKVKGQGSIGFGSGTIIASTAEESIILTCAHIFKLEGRQQVPPAKFPREIAIDLFDGQLSTHHPRMVHYANETYPGRAIDYDFVRDVGLIRIKPGRKLPYSRVVPAHWKPKERMAMTTVGCSEGRDATAWSTSILNPAMRGRLSGNPLYEAIECVTAPKQGRSGGGLYTTDGYVAGVCDFAEPQGNHGLYATPASIYSILDRNNLKYCYAPVKAPSQTLLASDRAGSRRRSGPPIARAQSPDRDEANLVMIPPPEMLGIDPPTSDATVPAARATAPVTSTRSGWHPTSPQVASRIAPGNEPAERTDLTLGREFDNDRFASIPVEPEPDAHAVEAPRPRTAAKDKWRPVRSALPPLQ